MQLRGIIQAALPKAKESIQWSQPVYDVNGPVCCLKVFRNDVRLGFWRGDQLPDPHQQLVPPSDRMRYLRFTATNQIDPRQIRALLKLAAKLNREFGDPTKPPSRAP